MTARPALLLRPAALQCRAGATVASTVTYLVPVCSAAADVILLGEPLTVCAAAGACIILTGAAMSQGGAFRAG